ncbi:MAG: hypothetical protein WCG27_10700, partial [Pseudomonadota bacterium]
MTRIYKDFQDFLDQNQSVLSFLGQNKQSGVLKAVWDARQGEVEELQKQVQESQKTSDDVGRQSKNDFFDLRSENENLSCQIIDYQRDMRLLSHMSKEAQKKFQEYKLKWEEEQKERLNVSEHAEKLARDLDLTSAQVEYLKKQVQGVEEKNAHLQFSLEPLELYGQQLRQDMQSVQSEVQALQEEVAREKKHSVELKECVKHFKDNAVVLKGIADQAKNEKYHAVEKIYVLSKEMERLHGELTYNQNLVLAKEQEKEEIYQMVSHVRQEHQVLKESVEASLGQKERLAQEILRMTREVELTREQQKSWAIEREGLIAAMGKLETDKEMMVQKNLELQETLKNIQNSVNLATEGVGA